MASDQPANKPDEKTAQHSGEDREAGKLPPGSGLDRRQDRNTEAAGQTSDGRAGPDQPDPRNP